MSTKLLEVDPGELRFSFEMKKENLCSLHLVNESDHYVAFKVKTTSPKKYSVRPNMSIIQPKLACDVIVTMEALWGAPPDTPCKDKFLIQSTIVPFGSSDSTVTPSMFTKDDGKFIEEHKLRVVLMRPSRSSVSQSTFEDVEQDLPCETPVIKDLKSSGIEERSSPLMHSAEDKELKLSKDVQEPKLPKDVKETKTAEGVKELRLNDGHEFSSAKDIKELKQSKDVQELKLPKDVKETKTAQDVEEMRLNDVNEFSLAKDIRELKQRIDNLDLKLHEVVTKITRMGGEKSVSAGDRQIVNLQMELLGKGNHLREVREGFSLLSVGFMAIFGVVLGYIYNQWRSQDSSLGWAEMRKPRFLLKLL